MFHPGSRHVFLKHAALSKVNLLDCMTSHLYLHWEAVLCERQHGAMQGASPLPRSRQSWGQARERYSANLSCPVIPVPLPLGEQPERDRLQAATRLVINHEAVVKFAARGCGQRGSRPVTAPLSDPSAKPGMEYLPAVDAGKLSIVLEHCAQSSSFVCFTPPGAV